ncbi:glycoside hydrolase family 31 protein [Daldinia loculata]|uniref:glycoside hydrolase family 31 protein n=1 Tax=Daldinia loculata TaxID=103429 RepID=UPI0020C561E5|nr:glycoside hydrolase family 31 protein [Daldinia loculata]KAI1649132.1 glycoside hydrolase family 31 protein [Daldinia loculata]
MASLLSLITVVTAVSAAALARRDYPTDDPLTSCPGYTASNVVSTASGLTADLKLAGEPCNVYGTDLKDLTLEVSYDTETRLHVKIQDAANNVYQIPESVFPRPEAKGSEEAQSALKFDYTESPFSFSVSRSDSGEVLFDTSAANIVFESQYLRLRTKLPENPSLYGLGEHSDPFMLNTTDYIRTFWSQDSFGVPEGANLYGNHPVYYEHRESGTHGVFFLNSNGMDVLINNTAESGQYLEYNTLGGVLDFYFVSGPSPVQVAQQYAEIVGLPVMQPYWGLGFQNCRYGYQDIFEVAEVVYNYSQAGIPLETMWNDIDYMYRRRVFSLDPERYPLHKTRELVDYLHAHDQHYVVMVDPAVAYQDFPTAFQRGVDDNIFMLRENGTAWKGVVWPGVTAFPDWFSPNISKYWNNEFSLFFSPENGVDIDALWIDMNEPSNFPCFFPCDNPDASAEGYPPDPPPVRTPPRALPGFSCDFQPEGTDCKKTEVKSLEIRDSTPPAHFDSLFLSPLQTEGQQLGLPDRDLLFPKYAIHNKAAYTDSANAAEGGISNKTVNTDLVHQNGLTMYDTHNLYGTMMSIASQEAMLQRRPTARPMIITRSTFAGAGTKVGHWLGDNASTWHHYRLAIRSMMAFASVYQIPMVGADTCGFDGNTTEQLCSRWAALGAFAPFYRVHNGLEAISQELYRWETVTQAARKFIDIRYRLLDYMYTALHVQTLDGTPMVNPLFFLYPHDKNTYPLDLQYFLGPGLLVAPVTEENSTSVDVYLPDDIFYDFFTHERIVGEGKAITVTDQEWSDLPLFLRGGVIIPLRTESAMTTTEVRTKPFEIIVPVGKDGKASGRLYLDDGASIEQPTTSDILFEYADGVLTVNGTFGYKPDELRISKVTFLGIGGGDSGNSKGKKRAAKDVVTVDVDRTLKEAFTVEVGKA